MPWAALIKCVYEVDPLKCPKCGGTVKIISFIERYQSDVIEKILRHCNLWKEEPDGYGLPPPEVMPKASWSTLDYGFFVSFFFNVMNVCFAIAVIYLAL